MRPTSARALRRQRPRRRSAQARGSTACGWRAARARRSSSFTVSAPISTAGGLWSVVCRMLIRRLLSIFPATAASPFAGETTLAALTAAVAATLAEEDVAAAHLVGHSLGGAVAAALTAAPGFRALSLALISPAGLGPEVNGAFIAGFLRARSEASLSPWMRELVADPRGARIGAGQCDLAPAGGGRVGRGAGPPRRRVVPRRRTINRHSSVAGRDRHSRQDHRRRRGSDPSRPAGGRPERADRASSSRPRRPFAPSRGARRGGAAVD